MSEYVVQRIKEQIKLYENQDPMTAETLARIEELEWVLQMVD